MNNNPHFKALLTFAPDIEGEGRSPVSSGYRAGIKFPLGQASLIAIFDFIDIEHVFPGDNVTAQITVPDWAAVAGNLYEGMDFEFFENLQLIGHGTVTKVLK